MMLRLSLLMLTTLAAIPLPFGNGTLLDGASFAERRATVEAVFAGQAATAGKANLVFFDGRQPTQDLVDELLNKYITNNVLNMNDWSISVHQMRDNHEKMAAVYALMENSIAGADIHTFQFADRRLKCQDLYDFLQSVLAGLRRNPSVRTVELVNLEHNGTSIRLIADKLLRGNTTLEKLRIGTPTTDDCTAACVTGPNGICDEDYSVLLNALARASNVTSFEFDNNWARPRSGSNGTTLEAMANQLTSAHRNKVDTSDRRISLAADVQSATYQRASQPLQQAYTSVLKRKPNGASSRLAQLLQEDEERQQKHRYEVPVVADAEAAPKDPMVAELEAVLLRRRKAQAGLELLAAAVTAQPSDRNACFYF